MYPLDTYPKDKYPLDTYPLDIYPLHIHPGYIPPYFEMPYSAHASCVDKILHFKKHIFRRIAFICNVDAIKLSDICCQEGVNPNNCSGSRWEFGWGVGWGEKLHSF